ncbi:srf-tf-domain-containing partial [Lichtheimia corymbifera JMRC:FSU:9682]|uniref:Srf-tf-domain-containing partial n=1 Tax=Lichtheimia corymbifera JMRC:FSU:9682 TaxID=1263082 RepID=A0A068SDW4_9FUNG|nr:srf-tf-domain-containing partial [Lichtheimia corymbifera JMRC:FSU:9682]
MHMDPSSSKEPVIKNKPFDEEEHDSADDSDSEKPAKRSGRRKIKIEYIEDKNRRHITFSKRKAGIMKKAYELSTLTGTQVLLLVVSETGLVYTFTTVKLQPIVTKPEGKNLIQACLNAPDPVPAESSNDGGYNNNSNASPRVEKNEDKRIDPVSHSQAAAASAYAAAASGAPPPSSTAAPPHPSAYPPQTYAPAPGSGGPMPVGANYPNYMGAPQYQQPPPQPSPQQQHHQQTATPQQPQHPSQQHYGQPPQPTGGAGGAPPPPGASFYGAQQPGAHPYMSQHPNYWPGAPGGMPPRADKRDDNGRPRSGLSKD